MQNGPHHQVSKRQKIIARSSTEADIQATDEFVKELLQLQHIINDMDTHDIHFPNAALIQI